MKQVKINSVKILFRFFSNALDGWTVETMWADEVDAERGLYKIDNIPFYASVASGDIVFAEYDDTEQMLIYRKTIAYSGNSTIQVVLLDTAYDLGTIRDMFKEFGCISEKLNDIYFVMEIAANREYAPIREKLTELEDKRVIGYAESALSDRHGY